MELGTAKIIFKAWDLYLHSVSPTKDQTYIVAKQADGDFGYFPTAEFALTSSNVFTGNQTINGNLIINGDITANEFLVTTSSVNHFTASTNFGLDEGDTHTFTGSVYITGSEDLFGDLTVSGNVYISGTTELGGNIVPKFPSGSTLGTLERPFRDIFVSSGSINVASDIIGDPNTSISNIGGNLLISAGGVRLIEPASFIAATGSFQYLSGSFTHIGTANRIGDTISTGSLYITGSGYINSHRILTDLDTGSFSNVGVNGSLIITGSLLITGSTTQIGNNTLIGNTILSGSVGISGSLNVNGNINVESGSEFYLHGNKLFNYGQFSDTTTQSGSANTAYSMKFNTTDFAHETSVVSGSRLTVANTGIYNLQFSAQLDNESNTNEVVDIWIAVTGSNVANSNSRVAINKAQAGNVGKVVAAWNYMIPLSASQYVELKWSSDGGNIILLTENTAINPTRPAIPSVIATITQIA